MTINPMKFDNTNNLSNACLHPFEYGKEPEIKIDFKTKLPKRTIKEIAEEPFIKPEINSKKTDIVLSPISEETFFGKKYTPEEKQEYKRRMLLC